MYFDSILKMEKIVKKLRPLPGYFFTDLVIKGKQLEVAPDTNQGM